MDNENNESTYRIVGKGLRGPYEQIVSTLEDARKIVVMLDDYGYREVEVYLLTKLARHELE